MKPDCSISPPSLTLPRKGGGNRPARAATQQDIFAANRAVGRIALAVGVDGGRSRRTRVHEQGSLRVRFPHAEGLEAVIVNTAGGIAGGDRFGVEIVLDAQASLVAGTAAAEKVYRSNGPDATVAVKLAVGKGGRLIWLPQETILFDRARLARSIDVDLAEDASLLLAEAVVFGRTIDRWRVRRGGRLVLAETVRLDGAIARQLAEPAVANGGIAIATVLIAPGDDEKVAAVRALEGAFTGEVGISAWNGIAVARLCAPDGAVLRHDLVALLAGLRAPLPRLWLH
jgi:urease accessory protein